MYIVHAMCLGYYRPLPTVKNTVSSCGSVYALLYSQYHNICPMIALTYVIF